MGPFKEFKDMKDKVDAMNAAYAAAAPRPDDPASEAHRVDATATVQSAQQTGIMVAQRRCARLEA